jgi:hypothetical protein
MVGPRRVGPDRRGRWGADGEETEGKEGGGGRGGETYNVELAAPVLMLREFERANMALVARLPASRSTEVNMAVVSFLLVVCGDCDGFCCGWGDGKYSRLLRLG